MNERIKELASQARNANPFWLVHVTPVGDVTHYALDEKRIYERMHNTEQCMEEYREVYNAKFAELIVAHATECVRDVLRDENSELTYPAASQVQNRIKEYFGVEE